MGTNYYVELEPTCKHCGAGAKQLHIGKSSGGWCFSLATHPDRGINLLNDWRTFLVGMTIEDEYGARVTLDDLMDEITNRNRSDRGPFSAEWLQQNHAVQGPNGLARHAIDGRMCTGHGEGTWDFMRGEFC